MAELTAAYGLPGGRPRRLLLLEQEEWDPYTGGLTKFAMVTLLGDLIYPERDYSPYYDCGIVDGSYSTRIMAYPLVDGLNYILRATHGELGERREELATMAETERVALDTEISIKYPVAELVSYDWQGDCYDADLAVVPPPGLSISADRQTIKIARPVYGSVAITYRVSRHVYSLSVPRRDEAAENRYSSVVYGVYDGGPPVHLVIDPPPGAEEMDGDCAQGGGGLTIEPPGEPPENRPDPHADRTTVYDWCTRELISDKITGV